ncbi:hypothetical protein MASR2M78_03000 [Treponema sp.]
MSDMREQVQKKKPRLALRFVLFSIVFALSAIAVLVQYGLVMLSPEQAKERLATRLSERGPILDRNGRILAMQTRLANISIWRPEIQDLPLFAGALAPLLELDAGELEARIKDSASDFIYAKKQVDQTVIQSVEEAIRAGKLKGAGIEPVVGRIYPEKEPSKPIDWLCRRQQRRLLRH